MTSLEPRTLPQILAENSRPLLVLEVNPPRGVDLSTIFQRLDGQLDGIDLLNVTDSALARMKLAALPFGSLLKARYQREVLVNFACRDRNVLAMQADLLGGWALGVRSVVALTGDAMTIGDSPDRKGVFEVNSVGLLGVIQTINSGRDMAGNELKGAPAYTAGVVVNPNVRNFNAELKRLRKKREAGAAYALSQPVFDLVAAKEFFQAAQEIGMPLFVGLLPLKSLSAAEAVSNIPGIRFPEALLQELRLRSDPDLSNFFLDHCLALAAELRDYVRGFHVVSGATPLLALKLARRLADWISKAP